MINIKKAGRPSSYSFFCTTWDNNNNTHMFPKKLDFVTHKRPSNLFEIFFDTL